MRHDLLFFHCLFNGSQNRELKHLRFKRKVNLRAQHCETTSYYYCILRLSDLAKRSDREREKKRWVERRGGVRLFSDSLNYYFCKVHIPTWLNETPVAKSRMSFPAFRYVVMWHHSSHVMCQCKTTNVELKKKKKEDPRGSGQGEHHVNSIKVGTLFRGNAFSPTSSRHTNTLHTLKHFFFSCPQY